MEEGHEALEEEDLRAENARLRQQLADAWRTHASETRGARHAAAALAAELAQVCQGLLSEQAALRVEAQRVETEAARQRSEANTAARSAKRDAREVPLRGPCALPLTLPLWSSLNEPPLFALSLPSPRPPPSPLLSGSTGGDCDGGW